ncbi:MAG: pyruvate dehydrogenase (acetyl-transferring) E1 component subunit alpha [Actinobacteria bacterium]|nr:pyruvate dehydrogenase (acetyl-transferring) E1 component subunit alpha [Actinomycetota bacterium]
MKPDQIIEALRLMLLSRALDEFCIKLQRRNRLGVYAPVHGQEAAVVGSAMALDPADDWMIPASREQPAMLRHGLPLENLLATYTGKVDHGRIPSDVKLLLRQQAIAAQLPHAVGLAWALKLRGLAAVALVYFGDGAASEGDFHEAANLAGVQNVPLIFFLINNRWAISTPVSKQTAAEDLSVRAAGYGFEGLRVDGDDLFAVYEATREAVARARAGGGPTLIEACTYRVGFHNTSDNPREYRDEAEVAAAEANDPIERVRRYATAAGIWSGEEEARISLEISTELNATYRKVASLPRPGPNAIFEHVYEEQPTRVRRQRDTLLNQLPEPDDAG